MMYSCWRDVVVAGRMSAGGLLHQYLWHCKVFVCDILWWSLSTEELWICSCVLQSLDELNSFTELHVRHVLYDVSIKCLTWHVDLIGCLRLDQTHSNWKLILTHPHLTSTKIPVRLCIHSFCSQWQIPAEVYWLSGLRSNKNKIWRTWLLLLRSSHLEHSSVRLSRHYWHQYIQKTTQ